MYGVRLYWLAIAEQCLITSTTTIYHKNDTAHASVHKDDEN